MVFASLAVILDIFFSDKPTNMGGTNTNIALGVFLFEMLGCYRFCCSYGFKL
jgi:hypothetical protein